MLMGVMIAGFDPGLVDNFRMNIGGSGWRRSNASHHVAPPQMLIQASGFVAPVFVAECLLATLLYQASMGGMTFVTRRMV